MTKEVGNLPGNSRYYDRHIYPRLSETIPLDPHHRPSTSLEWFRQMNLINQNAETNILEIGCGAGRNLLNLGILFPNAKLNFHGLTPRGIS